jgi:hypothetical protein
MTGRLLTLSVLALLGFYRHQPVTLEVRDAESGLPIRDARVDVHYLRFMQLLAPGDFSGKTDGNGKILLQVANWDNAVHVSTSADGYIENERSLPPVSKKSKRRTDKAIVVSLYKKLSLQIELILPKGFRGVLKVRHLPTEFTSGRPRQRMFSVQVPNSGRVDIPNTPPFQDVRSIEWLATYDDGTPLPSLHSSPLAEHDETVALRWITAEHPWITAEHIEDLFVVGTSDDEHRIRDRLFPTPSPGHLRGHVEPGAFEQLKLKVIP